MSVVVELLGLELHGHHGVGEEERLLGQRLLFDLWLEVGEEAARSDRLEDAVDYRRVADVVRAVSDERRFALLEALAGAVVDALLARFPIRSARVRVRKPEVRLSVPVEHSAVTVERASS